MSQKKQADWLREHEPGVLVTPPCCGVVGNKECGWPACFVVKGKWYCHYCVYGVGVRSIIRKARRAQKKALEE